MYSVNSPDISDEMKEDGMGSVCVYVGLLKTAGMHTGF